MHALLEAHRARRKKAAESTSPAAVATAAVVTPSAAAAAAAAGGDSGSELELRYKQAIKPLQFAECGMRDTRGEYTHHYRQRMAQEKIGKR